MTSPNFSAIRARLRYESLDDFMAGYTPFISKGGMFIPMSPSKLKPVGTTVRFQFLLQDGTTAMLGEGVVRQIQGIDSGDNSPVGMLVKFTRLNRESKAVVAQILARKDAAPATTEPQKTADSARLDDTPVPQSPPQAPEENAPHTVEFDSGASKTDAPQPDSTEQAPDAQPAEPPSEPAPADDDADPFGLGDFDFEMDSNASTDGLDASGSDVFAESEASIQPDPPAEPAPTAERAEGPKQLGSTEAGLQIMAFDAVSDDEAAGLADLDFGGDEGDVDQMFDDVFGGGGFFGGAEDDAQDASPFGGDFELEADAPDDADEEPVLLGATAHDGGELLPPQARPDANHNLEAHADPTRAEDLDDEEFVLDEEFVVDEAAQLEEQPQDATPPPFSSEDELFSDDELTSDAELISDHELLSEDIDLAEASSTLLGDDDLEDAEALLEWDEEEPDAGDDAEFDLVAEAEEVEEPQEAQEPAHSAQPSAPSGDFEIPTAPETALGEERSAPSADLLSVLGTLDTDEETPDIKSITLGSGAGIQAVTDDEVAQEEEEEDSLSALLAKAQHEIDAKRESEQPDANAPGDIFDDLLGDQDQLPPPPDIQPVFDIADVQSAKKKKKGGFMSKLFGKE